MKNKFYFLAVYLIISTQLSAQNSNIEWVRQLGGTHYDQSSSITTDNQGNVYTIGRFSNTVDFNPGLDTYYLKSKGVEDIFIQKLDSDGNFVWVKQMGGASIDIGTSITIDANGNIYSTGYFRGTIDIDPGEDTATLISSGFDDIFIQKLDPNGDFLWAKQIGGTSLDVCWSIITDTEGFVYTTGLFRDTVNFDPNNKNNYLTSAGNSDVFIQKLDADGNLIWVKQIGGIDNDSGSSISIDIDGNVYTTGSFRDIVDFDPSNKTINLISDGNVDAFILKLDNNGDFLWVKQMGGISSGNSIITDSNGFVYSTGQFQGTIKKDINSKTINLVSAGGNDIYTLKINKNGDFVWIKQIGGIGEDVGFSIVLGRDNDLYSTGWFSEKVNFNPENDTIYLSSNGFRDIFIQKLNLDGDFKWVNLIGGISDDAGISISSELHGHLYVTGIFDEIVDFGTGLQTTNLTSMGDWDTFILKINSDLVTGSIKNQSENTHLIYPNPIKNNFKINLNGYKNLVEINIYDLNGKLIQSRTYKGGQVVHLTLEQPTGVYLLSIKSDSKSSVTRLFKE